LYRSLNAYKQTFNSQQDLIVLEPSSKFFQYFNNARPGTGPSVKVPETQSSVTQ